MLSITSLTIFGNVMFSDFHVLFYLLMYAVTKQRDPDSRQHSLFYQVDYPEIVEGVVPRHRFMSAYEQKMEPPDRQWQYLLFAAEPYETIGFKVRLICAVDLLIYW